MASKQNNTRSSGGTCSVHGCTNNQRKLNALLDQPCFDHKPRKRSECSCDPPYRLHRMPPGDSEVRRQWLAALKRKHPPANVFACSFHFVGGKPSQQHPVPELYLGYEKKVVERRVLVRCSSTAGTEATEQCIRGTRKRKSTTTATPYVSPAKQLIQDGTPLSDSDSEVTGPILPDLPVPETSCLTVKAPCAAPTSVTVNCLEASTQYVDPSTQDHGYAVPWLHHPKKVNPAAKKDCQVQCQIKEDIGLAGFLLTCDSDAKLYTGIDLLTFRTLVTCLIKHGDRRFRLPVADQILITLMKLRLNLLYADIARRFSISNSLVSKIVSYWIDTMAIHLTKLIVWLPREVIRATTPRCFSRYPKTTCIMDCAETFMQKPSRLRSRGESYSRYKSHNTVKYCVTIAPCGLIMHISRAYGGRASDKFIVMDSGVLNRILPGDEVMADRGFTIQDLLFQRRASLNIPAFSQGKQLPPGEVTRTRRIAKVRIHVERAIRRLKVFRILKETVPVSMAPKIDKILRISAGLVNLGTKLIRDQVAADE
ncbi:hypothetical protein BaRGS_00013264 [Batillaria attramentaria]|uniref:THAP-type domain-containing protein n=1 Tax=Batillaria attramentaria TaxID=370345 RepID=A0ABD0L7P2_9CAEN